MFIIKLKVFITIIQKKMIINDLNKKAEFKYRLNDIVY